MLETNVQTKTLEWFELDKYGQSSKCLAFHLCGIKTKMTDAPKDPSDLNRCFRYLKYVPELKENLNIMTKVSPYWSLLVENWDLLEKTFVEEVGEDWKQRDKSATNTYNLMEDLQKKST